MLAMNMQMGGTLEDFEVQYDVEIDCFCLSTIHLSALKCVKRGTSRMQLTICAKTI